MIELGLQKISKLLAQSPLPWRAVHIAGTNGKGSVCAYISEMLNTYNQSHWREVKGQSRIRHGRFTSPHIVDRWDCITLSKDDEMQVVRPAVFLETEEKVVRRNRELGIGASEFELLTATAFEIFTQSKLDVAVIETGMGGRLDATNIVGQPLQNKENIPNDSSPFRTLPLVTAITKVGLDHQGFLGHTVEAIAREKAGIFKPGVPALWDYSNQPSVVEVLEAEAKKKGSRIVDETGLFLGYDVQPILDDACNASGGSRHLVENSSVALRATWTALSALGRLPSNSEHQSYNQSPQQSLIEDMARAPSRVKFPGRLEWIDISKLVGEKSQSALLDGAHNAQSAEVLSATVAELRADQNRPTVWVVAASDTKDVREILRLLLKPGDSVFAVEFGAVDGMPWVKPMKIQDILAAARLVTTEIRTLSEYGIDILGALRAANALRKESAKDGEPANLVIAGSLYLVGDVHRLLQTNPTT